MVLQGCLAVALLLALAGTARAQECPPEAAEAALGHFAKAEKAYHLGQWDKAIAGFTAAFDACPDQWYLYGLGQTYRQKDDCRNAIHFYQRFLDHGARQASHLRRPDVEKMVRDEMMPQLQARCADMSTIGPDGPVPPATVDTGKVHVADSEGEGEGEVKSEGEGEGEGEGVGESVGASEEESDDDEDADEGEDKERPPAATTVKVAGGKQTRKVALDGELGAGFVTGLGRVDVPARFSLRLAAGYPLRMGQTGLVAGGMFTYTGLPWTADGNRDGMRTSGSASLVGLLVGVSATHPVRDRIAIRGEMGAGVQLFAGLGSDNPFTVQGSRTTGALGMFAIRVALGAEYALTPKVVLTACLPGISYSPTPSGLHPDVGSITRVEILFGAGYRM